MKTVFQLVVLGLTTSLLLSCGKSEIKAKNPNAPAQTPAPTPGPAQPNSNPPPVVVSEEVNLNSELLLLSKSGVPHQINKLESSAVKSKARLTKKFTLKSEKKLSLNFKAGLQGVGRSQCEIEGSPEVTATIKIGDKETASKYADLTTLELGANQDFTLTIAIDNSKKCAILSFEFAILSSEINEDVPPVIVQPPVIVPGTLVVETKEFLSAGSFGACFDLACFTRDLKTSTKKYLSPTNKSDEITEDHFALSESVELVCLNRRNVADNTGITNSICKLVLNPSLTNSEIKIYRGQDKKSNLVGVDITTPTLLEKLCNKFPTVTSDDKVEVFVDDTNKKEIPRLEISCSYDNNQKAKSATIIGVLN